MSLSSNDNINQSPSQSVVSTDIESIDSVDIPQSADNEAVTFDEFDRLTDSSARQEAPQLKEEVKKITNELSEEAQKEDNAREAKEKAAALGKPYKYKLDDQEMEMSPGAEFSVIVNGKPEKVILKDLVSNYSGKVHWDKKFQELSVEKKNIQTEKDDLRGIVHDFWDLFVTQKNPMGAVYFVSELLKTNPEEAWNSLKSSIPQENLDESALKSYEQEQTLKYYRNKEERASKHRESISEKQAMDERIQNAMLKAGMDERAFLTAYDTLVASGKYKPEQITPEFVAEKYGETKIHSTIESIIQSVNPDYKNKDNAIQYLMKAKQDNPELSDQDLKDIAVEVIGKKAQVIKAAKAISKKIQRQEPERMVSQAKRSSSSGPLFFDDLE